MVLLALGLGVLLGVMHFFSDRIDLSMYRDKMKLMSFTSGILITYLFLDLFPQFYAGSRFVTEISLLFVLIGFAAFHVLERYTYRHASRKSELRKELKEEHSAALFLYHVAIGMILVDLTGASALQGLLFFVPIMLYSLTSTISLKEIDGELRASAPVKALLSFSTLIGTAIAAFFSVQLVLFDALIGFIAGSLLYIVIMDSIPREKKGKPAYFILGIAVYALAIFGLKVFA